VTHTKRASNAAVSDPGTSLDFTLVVNPELDGNRPSFADQQDGPPFEVTEARSS
jgi:hypothetical protein